MNDPRVFSHDVWEQLVERTFDEVRKLGALKGGEYSGDEDRLANFRRNAADIGVTKETVWRVYAAKHWDAIGQYIRDLTAGKERTRLESLAGRADDLIVYLLLFKAMLAEREATIGTSEKVRRELNMPRGEPFPPDTEADDERKVPRRPR